MLKQKQITKNSGTIFHFSLDSITVADLSACRAIHLNYKADFSHAVLVRRAVRLYRRHLERMAGEQRMVEEKEETTRAAEGSGK